MTNSETQDIRLKRLHMRSWRRGMKEMDMILGPFADGPLADLEEAELLTYEALLDENDQLLYRWITTRISGERDDTGPPELEHLLDIIAEHAAERFRGNQHKTAK